jgi:phage shock protein A
VSPSWNPPTGPPNGSPVPPAEARREIEQAIVAAQTEDQHLRAQMVAVVHARVGAAVAVEAATADADEARTLAKRALRQADDSARIGQRADTARWTSAAEVFAKRLRDARDDVVEAERQIAAAGPELDRLHTALGENVGRVRAVAAARIPMLSGRKATKAQRLVDEAVAGLTAPLDDLVAQAETDARAHLDAAAQDADGEVSVVDDDLERELDDAGVDDILHELRAELGLVVDGEGDEANADDVAAGDLVPDGVDPAAGDDPDVDREHASSASA